jgi:hypothetical protein
MPSKCIAAPSELPEDRLDERPGEEGAFAAFPDWWRQIDRWVNEGGADERTAAAAQHLPRSVEP